MKNKNVLSIVLFFIGFIVAYLFMCYCIPGLRIKLIAEPVEYFIESVKYAAMFKGIVSFIVGTIFAILPQIIQRNKKL